MNRQARARPDIRLNLLRPRFTLVLLAVVWAVYLGFLTAKGTLSR